MDGLSDIIYFAMDLAGQILKRGLMAYMVHGLLSVKSRYEKGERWVKIGFVVVSVTFYMMIHYLSPMKKLLLGDEQGLVKSRASILPMLLSLLLMTIYCLYFYAGRKSEIIYPVFTVYTVHELILFTLHSLFVLLMEGISAVITYLAVEQNGFFLAHFMEIFGIIQLLWNLSYQVVFFVLLYKGIKSIYQNLASLDRRLGRIQEAFLFVPVVMGFCFCILVRSILFDFKGPQVMFLMDEYPESWLLIPVVSGLCLLSIILSAVVLRKLVESSEQEMLVEVYQTRISDMEEHMRDVERLYDGIRGMRHDMKNHVADLELLMKRESGDLGSSDDTGGETSERYGEEMRRYLDDLCNTMEELDMQCSTGNPVTDVVVSRKMRKAEQEKILFENSFIFPKGLGFSAFDVSILLNNGLDNALEAVRGEKNPYIKLDSYVKNNMFFIEIRNTFTGTLRLKEGSKMPLTQKGDDMAHGFGMKNMLSCAEKYYGTLRWEANGGMFLLEVMLQGMEETNGTKWN